MPTRPVSHDSAVPPALVTVATALAPSPWASTGVTVQSTDHPSGMSTAAREQPVHGKSVPPYVAQAQVAPVTSPSGSSRSVQAHVTVSPLAYVDCVGSPAAAWHTGVRLSIVTAAIATEPSSVPSFGVMRHSTSSPMASVAIKLTVSPGRIAVAPSSTPLICHCCVSVTASSSRSAGKPAVQVRLSVDRTGGAGSIVAVTTGGALPAISSVAATQGLALIPSQTRRRQPTRSPCAGTP